MPFVDMELLIPSADIFSRLVFRTIINLVFDLWKYAPVTYLNWLCSSKLANDFANFFPQQLTVFAFDMIPFTFDMSLRPYSQFTEAKNKPSMTKLP